MVKILYALYDLEKRHTSTLSLEEGEVFLSVDDGCRDGDWLCVVNGRGEVGFVPETYVESKEATTTDLLVEIERKLAAIHENAVKTTDTGSCKYTSQQKLFLRKLLEARKTLQKDDSFIHVNDVKDRNEVEEGLNEPDNSDEQESDRSVPLEESPTSPVSFCSKSAQTDSELQEEEKFDFPPLLLPNLVESVRNSTNLSHTLSVVAVATVLQSLKDEIPSLSSTFARLLADLSREKNDQSTIIESQDKQKLLEIFKRLWMSKDDEQQRSWPVHEDECVILSSLQELYRILVDADPRMSSEVVKSEDYELVLMLITYYQMETRHRLRLAMLHVFIALCQLSPPAVEHLLSSVLPVELARDMQSHRDNVELVKYSAFLLTIILSYGQHPPRELYEYINVSFVTFLLGHLQDLLEYTGDEDVANLCFSVVLAINLHKNDNIVIEAIKLQDDVRALTEKLMLVINRGDDPTRLLDVPVKYPNSVLKLLVDLFANPTCAEHFYTNDVKVLLDILVRHLQDLPYGSQERCSFLELVLQILHNTDYGEHCHQQDGLQKCFESMLLEEDSPNEEKIWVKRIAQEFPDLFSLPATGS